MNQLQFLRSLVVFNGAVPLAMLAWDAWGGRLGANSVNHALHITGILSLVFLLLSLLTTPLRWCTGWGGWIAFRRALGLYAFFHGVVHFAIYVIFDRALSVSSTLHEIGMRRYLQVGTVALLLMIPLAATSTNAMIQRMGPRRWKTLHRATYLVAILGVLHYYLLVKSDVRQPLAFAGVLAALLGARAVRSAYNNLAVARPMRRPSRAPAPAPANVDARLSLDSANSSERPNHGWKGELRVAEIVQETLDVKTFRLVSPDGGPLPFEYLPGQFVNIQLEIAGKRVNRSYTLASSPSRADHCELTIKRDPDGLASRYLHDEIQAGDRLKLSGPSGKFVFTGEGADSVLLIAGGVGITPLMSILRYLSDRNWPGDIYFLNVAKTEHDLIFRREIDDLRKRFPKLELCTTLTRCEETSGWSGERGRLSEASLARFVPSIERTPVYLCGPNEMMDAAVKVLSALGVPAGRIHTEAFAGKKLPVAKAVASPEEPARVAANVPKPPAPWPLQIKSIRFVRSNVQTESDSETTLLEAAEAASVSIPFECRSGFCGQCKTRLVMGTVRMDSEDALSTAEKSSGLVLACQARATTSVEVDA